MVEKKSILEEALLDITNIQNALNANTKEILRSVAKEEIDSVVKESLLKEEFEEEDLESDTEVETEPVIGDEETGAEAEDSLEDVIDDVEAAAPEAEVELPVDTDVLGGEEMDMTSASDDDVIAIYKKLSGEDEIEIVGDEIHLNISEPGEYVVKATDSVEGGEVDALAATDDLVPVETGDDSDDVSVDYEIEMGDEESEEDVESSIDDLVPVGDEGEEEESEEEETEETLDEKIGVGIGMSVGTHRNEKTGGSINAPENPKSTVTESASKKLVSETKQKYNTLLTEATKLKAENEEFRKALKVFRSQLVETVVFNSNLTYTTRLFMEHSTTKVEKQNIIKRFDEEVSNLKESKKLYKTIANELENRKPINESVENKIIKEVTTGASKQLNESTAYVDPSTKRIIDLIGRVEKR